MLVHDCLTSCSWLACVNPISFLALAALKLFLYCENTNSNWIVFRRVRHVEDPPEPEPLHLVLRLLRYMGSKVVHEKTDLLVRVGSSDAGEVLLELVDVDRSLEDLIMFEPLIFGDPSK